MAGDELLGEPSRVTAPDGEPIDVDEAKLNLRVDVDQTADDDLIEGLITEAREAVEQKTGRQLLPAVYELRLDSWPCAGVIEVPWPPLQSVASIQYLDAAGATQTWATSNYVVATPSGPQASRGRVALAFGKVWPVTLQQMNAITLRFTAGYADADSVPRAIKRAMLLLIGHWYENREQVVVGPRAVSIELERAVDWLLADFRVWPVRMGR